MKQGYARMRRVVRNLKYKPDTTLSFSRDMFTGWVGWKGCLLVTMQVPNVNRPVEPLNLSGAFPLTDEELEDMSVDECRDFVREAIRAFEAHESHEWFRYKGQMLYDPHKPGNKAWEMNFKVAGKPVNRYVSA